MFVDVFLVKNDIVTFNEYLIYKYFYVKCVQNSSLRKKLEFEKDILNYCAIDLRHITLIYYHFQ